MQIASLPCSCDPFYFWSLANHFPDLADCTFNSDLWANSVLVVAYHGSTIRMVQFALSVNKTVKVWLISSLTLAQIFPLENLKLKITMSNQADGVNICWFIDNSYHHHKVLLLLGGLHLPIGNVTNMLIKRFIVAAVGKIHKLCQERLPELEVPWITGRL